MDEPLVLLPFDPVHLAEAPTGVRYARYDGADLPAGWEQTAFFVPPYQIGRAAGRLVEQMPGLRAVQTLTAGVDFIRDAVPDGVLLCNGRGIHDASTSELAVALTLASLRGIPDFCEAQQEARWSPERRRALADSRVLIVGYGQIGAAIEARLRPFEVEITRVARSARDGVHAFGDLPGLLPDADVVILIVPGTAETKALVDAAFLANMGDGALLVNVARGSVVDQDALLAELTSGRLHAAVDVTDPEPLPPDHPLWSAPNLLITPHVGGDTDALWPRAYRLVREQLQRFVAGEPLANVVTGEY